MIRRPPRSTLFPYTNALPIYFLGFEVDRDRSVGAARGVVQQFVQVFRADRDRQDAVLEAVVVRSEEHTSELQSHVNLVCRLLLERKNCTSQHSVADTTLLSTV